MILSPSTLVSDYAYEWLTTYQEPAVSAAVYRAQKSLVDRLIVPAVGRLRLRDVRPIQLQKIINAQPDKSKNYYVKPVSYTHLDVYKRQDETRLPCRRAAIPSRQVQ